MKHRELNSIFKFANLAKDSNQHLIANLLFGYLLASILEVNATNLKSSVLKDLKFEVETHGKNRNPNQDLLVIINKYEDRFCIPLPLLSWKEAVRSVKRYPLVKRLEHNRQTIELSKQESADLKNYLEQNFEKFYDKAKLVLNDDVLSEINNRLNPKGV